MFSQLYSFFVIKQQPQVLLSASKGDKWEIPPQYVDNVRCIGRGGFGKVYEAVVRGYTTTVLDLHIRRNNHSHSVAVKTLKGIMHNLCFACTYTCVKFLSFVYS